MKRRLQYFDTIRFAATMWIFIVHFIADFRPSLFRFWTDFPTALILGGITGKFAVAILAVLLGYFAYLKGTQKKELHLMIASRYISFLAMGIVINVIIVLCEKSYHLDFSALKEILLTSIHISSKIYPTFWCMQSFFWGSAMSYINGKYGVSLLSISIQALMLIVTHNIWIAICLFGNILYRITEDSIASPNFQKFAIKPLIQVFMILIALFIIKRSESDLTYVLDGISSLLIMTVISYNQKIQKPLCNDALSYLGKYSMGIFLLHPTIYSNVGQFVYSRFSDSKTTFLLAFSASVVITIPLSIIIVGLINRFSNILTKVYICITEKLDSRLCHLTK